MMNTTGNSVSAHYGSGDLAAFIRHALETSGKDLANLTTDDLAPVDQFHIGGKEMTRELAALAGIRAGQTVLDAGGGIGGPARALASEFGAAVTVLDLTEAYVRAGVTLTEWMGLTGRVAFKHGSATEIPFADGAFDVVWTQHAAMNIADKTRLYAEFHRVLKPGGRLALHDVMAGPVQPVFFPVPWAREPSISFLQPPDEIRASIERAGFHEVAWVDVTETARNWFLAWAARLPAGGPPPLGIHLLLGPVFAEMGRNMLRNLDEGRIAVIQAVFDRV